MTQKPPNAGKGRPKGSLNKTTTAAKEAIARAAETALGVSDLVVIIGGASVGDHDLARAALDALGAELVFSKVAVRPGKPTWFALCDGKPVLGLPGNPASALVCARLFLRPALDTMLGRAGAFPFQAARLREPLAGNDQRESYLRAALETDDAGQAWARCFPAQDSSLLSVFAASDCLVRRAAHAPAAAAGEIVPILKF